MTKPAVGRRLSAHASKTAPVIDGRLVKGFFENAREVALIIKPAGGGDIRNGVGAARKEPARVVEADAQEQIRERHVYAFAHEV